MKKTYSTALVLMLIAGMVFPSATAFAARPSSLETVRVLIGFNQPTALSERVSMLPHGVTVRHSYNVVDAMAIEVPVVALPALERNPNISVVEHDVTVHALDYQSELTNTWGVEYVGAGAAHMSGYTGQGVKVGVIDTGIDYTHPDVSAHYRGGYDFVNGDNDPMDDNGHGTHIAGTIAGVRDGSGVVGMAPDVDLYALKVLDQNGNGQISDIIAAIDWATTNNLQITNSSFGAAMDPGILFRSAYANAEALGVLSIAAAGNSGTCSGASDTINYPAKYSSVVAVAAVDINDTRPCFSSTGYDVEIAAPGVAVRSTKLGGGYADFSGTSMATPHVVGAAALLIAASIADENSNGRVNDDARSVLNSTARDVGTSGRDTQYGFGVINVPAAIAAIGGTVGGSDPTPTPSPTPVVTGMSIDSISYANSGRRSLTITITVVDENGNAVSGATIDGTLTNTMRRRSWNIAATTDSNGRATYTLNRAPYGSYSTTITSVTKSGYTWDGVTPGSVYFMWR